MSSTDTDPRLTPVVERRVSHGSGGIAAFTESAQPVLPPSRARAFVVRHPMASFLVMAYAVMWTAWLPVIFLDAPPRPMSTLGALLGLAAPAFIVTAATEGRQGVRNLVRRSLRWRVGAPWYLVALLAIPVGTVLLAAVALGTSALEAVGATWADTLVTFGVNVLVALVTVQLFEEVGWTGFAQHRAQQRRGALRASLAIAVAFALIHLPTYFTAPITGEQTLEVLARMVPFVVIAVFLRVLFTWMYNRTAFSVLLVAVLHASLNTASGSEFYSRLGDEGVAMMLPLGAAVLLALVVAVVTKGRLGLTRVDRS